MTRRAQIVHLTLFLSGLAGLTYAVTGSVALPTGDASIWIHSGLLMVILGMYWIEPYFTKPSDAVINGLVVFISTSTLSDPPYESWWNLLRYSSLGVVVVAFLVVWAGSPAIAGNDTSSFKRVVYQVVIRVGNAAVLYSAVFLLALLSYFDPRAPISRWVLGFWTLLLVAKHLDLGGFIRSVTAMFRRRPAEILGRLSRFAHPNVARFEVGADCQCPRGALVAFTRAGVRDPSSPLAVVVAHRSGPTRVEAECILVASEFAEGALEKYQVVVKADPNDPGVQARLSDASSGPDPESVIGFATRETDISRLRFEIVRGADLEEGYLVGAPSLAGPHILFQLVNGLLYEEASLESGERAFTVGEAQQLGTWDGSLQGFASHAWVVPENAPVFRHGPDAQFQKTLKRGVVDIGQIPSSSFPANLNLSELVLYHSAVLGVTGSGKSFLAYFLIEKCAEAGIKVLCLDLTGDYQRYIRGGVRIASSAAIAPFLNDADRKIGIVEFTDKTHPIRATKTIAEAALAWCRQNRRADEIREPTAKVLIVLEEAHSLVPEWNSNPVPELRNTVNATAQIALQARKYGLGFMVITQRTANVTKSILNQCNTIFAFQAYDETGFEFMKNYMGSHYVQALPNLKKRQGVVVGKASTSDRPVIVRFHDQDRQAAAAELPAFAPTPGMTEEPPISGTP